VDIESATSQLAIQNQDVSGLETLFFPAREELEFRLLRLEFFSERSGTVGTRTLVMGHARPRTELSSSSLLRSAPFAQVDKRVIYAVLAVFPCWRMRGWSVICGLFLSYFVALASKTPCRSVIAMAMDGSGQGGVWRGGGWWHAPWRSGYMTSLIIA
jgi:hypothetical protein